MGIHSYRLQALCFLAVAWVTDAISIPRHATLASRQLANETEYDFIIAGGGLSGLTVANRLTEDRNVKVLVIEAGPLDVPEESFISVPGLYNPLPYLYPGLDSVPQTALDDKSFLAPAGKVVGGGSLVHSLLWFRSSKEEYSAWSQLGSTDLDWDVLLPYFKKNENFSIPDPAFARKANISYETDVHGFNGPIHVSYPNSFYNGSGNWWEAALSLGLDPVKDLNDGNQAGISFVTFSIDPTNRTRSDARTGYYSSQIASRPNYHLLTNHTVSKILVNGNRTTGVEYVPSAGGSKLSAQASKEVLVAAGGVHTPQLLQLSGIGPKSILNKYGIPVVANLPGVGTNLQDTPNFNIPYNVTNNVQPNQNTFATNATYDAQQLAIYNSLHTGPYVIPADRSSNVAILPLRNITSNYESIVQAARNRDPAASLPAGTDPTVLAGYKAQRQIRLGQLESQDVPAAFLQWETGNTVTLFQGTQLSRGSININSTNALDIPVIDWRSMTDPTDYQIMVATVLKNRQIMNAPGMKSLGAHEAAPFGDTITDSTQLQNALASVGEPTLAHMCCTAPQMDLAKGGVVDANYNVYNVQGLRVIDIAAIPLLPTLPPQAPLYALAERIADLIKKEYSLS